MKVCRFIKNGNIHFGIVEDDIIRVVNGDIFNKFILTDEKYSLTEIKLLTPIDPSKIVAVGKNYVEHAKEFGSEVPSEPCLFIKPNSAILEPFGNIIYPSFVKRLDFEGELAIVIKKKCKNISREEANDYIFGYTILNDVTARDIQENDGQWTRAKSMDTFAPFGPFIETELNPNNLDIETRLNDDIKQKSNTSNFVFDAFEIISYISKNMTLEEGDIVTTGTPEGVGPMEIGDKIEVSIENIGTLVNYVRNDL